MAYKSKEKMNDEMYDILGFYPINPFVLCHFTRDEVTELYNAVKSNDEDILKQILEIE